MSGLGPHLALATVSTRDYKAAGHTPQRSHMLARHLVLAALVPTLLLSGCNPSRGGGGGGSDDDDSAAGDDDTSAGDDDTSSGDDDTSSGDDDTSTGDDDTSTGDDDTSTGDDDTTPEDNLVASGSYYTEYDWSTELEGASGWTDCLSTFTIDPSPDDPPEGCPGCFAVFRADMDFVVHTCGDALAEVFDLEGINFGVSGNVLWLYNYADEDWMTWMTGTATSDSFVGQGAWVPQTVEGYDYDVRESIELEWF